MDRSEVVGNVSVADRIAGGLKAEFLARVIYTASNALLLLLLTRFLLDPDEYGMLYLALSVLGIAELFSVLGLPKSTARYVTEYVEKDTAQVPHILRLSLNYNLIAIGVVSAVLAAARVQIAGYIGEPELASFLLVGVGYVAVRSTTTYLRFVFQAFNQVKISALLKALTGVSRVVLACAFVLVGFGALGALFGYTLGFAIVSAVGFVLLHLRFFRGFDTADRSEEGLGRRILRYAVPTTATRAGVALDSRVDTILVGAFLNPTAAGIYTLAGQIVKFSIVPATSLGFTISPALGERKAKERTEHASKIYEQSLKHVLMLYVPGSVGLFLVAEPLIRYVFGSEYLGVVPILYMFSFFIVVRAVHKITGGGLDYLGLAGIRSKARIVSAIGNLLLNLLLIPLFGVIGAAVATVVSYTGYTAVTVYVIHRELSLRPRAVLPDLTIIGAIATIMGVIVLALLPHISNIVGLFTVIAVGAGVWLVLSVASGILSIDRTFSFLS